MRRGWCGLEYPRSSRVAGPLEGGAFDMYSGQLEAQLAY